MKSVLIGLCVIAPMFIGPAIAPALGATLKATTTLNGSRVYLRDLFEDAGENADRVLGPGPSPGGRIVVEARQLKAIARLYDVDWEPVSSADRAVLEWPGRPLKREEATAAARRALIAQGAAPDCDVDLAGFNPPVVPLSGTTAPVVSQLDYDPRQGHFNAILSVTAPGIDPITMRISGEVADVIAAPVTVTRLPAGSIAGPDDVRMARVRVSAVRSEVARDLASVIGMQFRRSVAAGAPIQLVDLTQPTQIGRGQPVRMDLQAGGLSLTGQGVALESGAVGDLIRVRNISSQAVIEATVVGPGRVRVIPGSSPITALARPGYGSARGG